MKPFLIQTIDGEIRHDFSFHLEEAVRYQNWYQDKEVYQVIRSEEPNQANCIPIGSLDFVFSYMEKYEHINKKNIIPLNIPKELFTPIYLKRQCDILFKSEMKLEEPKFIKSATQYKAFTDVTSSADGIPDDLYLVSDEVDIESEWRLFVYQHQLVGVHHYAGDFTKFPDMELAKEAIHRYQNSPPAYTLDVGINSKGTFVIEVHPFISCGLYGFRDYRILPQMFQSAYHYQLQRSGKS